MLSFVPASRAETGHGPLAAAAPAPAAAATQGADEAGPGVRERGHGGEALRVPDVKRWVCDEEQLSFVERSVRWREPRRVGAGLENCGNTCFLNAVLQCLAYTPALSQALLERVHSRRWFGGSGGAAGGGAAARGGPTPDGDMWVQMERTVAQMLVGGGRGWGGGVRPGSILERLPLVRRNLRVGRQEDAHEFLRCLLESMHRAELAHAGVTENNRDNLGQTSLVHGIFGGWLRSQTRCAACHANSNVYDSLLDLELDIAGGVRSLAEALRRYAAPETLDASNLYKCEHCGKRTRARRQICIRATPNVLCITLKRFAFHQHHHAGPHHPFLDFFGGAAGMTKLSHAVDFPEVLDFRPAMAPEAVDEGQPWKYHLHGVLVHSGATPFLGHYFSYVRSPAGTWALMNDSAVSSVGLSHVLQQRAYVLFYSRDPAQPFLIGKPPAALHPLPERRVDDDVEGAEDAEVVEDAEERRGEREKVRVEREPVRLTGGPSDVVRLAFAASNGSERRGPVEDEERPVDRLANAGAWRPAAATDGRAAAKSMRIQPTPEGQAPRLVSAASAARVRRFVPRAHLSTPAYDAPLVDIARFLRTAALGATRAWTSHGLAHDAEEEGDEWGSLLHYASRRSGRRASHIRELAQAPALLAHLWTLRERRLAAYDRLQEVSAEEEAEEDDGGQAEDDGEEGQEDGEHDGDGGEHDGVGGEHDGEDDGEERETKVPIAKERPGSVQASGVLEGGERVVLVQTGKRGRTVGFRDDEKDDEEAKPHKLDVNPTLRQGSVLGGGWSVPAWDDDQPDEERDSAGSNGADAPPAKRARPALVLSAVGGVVADEFAGLSEEQRAHELDRRAWNEELDKGRVKKVRAPLPTDGDGDGPADPAALAAQRAIQFQDAYQRPTANRSGKRRNRASRNALLRP